MKKIIFYSLSAMLLVGGVYSCKKATKGKVTSDWNVTAWEDKTTTTSNSGFVSTETVTSDGTTIKVVETSTPSGGSTTTSTTDGTVQLFNYTIDKDGTWKHEMEYTFTETFTGGSYTEKTTVTNSGTWDFLKGIGEFKRNERMILNTLSSSSTTVATTTIGSDASTSTSTNTDTYADGENALIYTVIESKRKELKLQSDINNKNTNTTGSSTSTDTTVGTTTITLTKAD